MTKDQIRGEHDRLQGLEAQPIAVECQGTLKVAHRKRNNVKAMIHGF